LFGGRRGSNGSVLWRTLAVLTTTVIAIPDLAPTLYAGTEVVEFSPTAELQKTLEVVSRNIEAVIGG
jgi:hypothetical protein